MTALVLIAALLVLAAAAYQAGRRRALATVGGNLRRLHSLPNYYGVYVALWCALPALLVLALWVALQGRIVEAVLVSELPPEARALPLREFRDHMEREYIRIKLDENGWNISRTATLLGIERTNLHKKMRALGLSRDSQGPGAGPGSAAGSGPTPS